jgi:hypothetical protein
MFGNEFYITQRTLKLGQKPYWTVLIIGRERQKEIPEITLEMTPY